MGEPISIELREDLLYCYQVINHMINYMEMGPNREGMSAPAVEEIIFRLRDLNGVMQKDIFHCSYMMSKLEMMDAMKESSRLIPAYKN